MFKTLTFVIRKPGLTAEEFSDHWRNVHGPIVSGTPELMRHIQYDTQHPVTETKGRTAPPSPFDGIVELAFHSRESARAFFKEPAYLERLQPDEANFVDVGKAYTIVVEDRFEAGERPD